MAARRCKPLSTSSSAIFASVASWENLPKVPSTNGRTRPASILTFTDRAPFFAEGFSGGLLLCPLIDEGGKRPQHPTQAKPLRSGLRQPPPILDESIGSHKGHQDE